MTCSEAPLVSAYLDRELDVDARARMDAHLATCSECAAVLARLEALRAAIAAAPLTYAPPPDLAGRIRAATRDEARPAAVPIRRPSRRLSIGAGAAIAAMLGWVVLANVVGSGGRQPLLDELVASHVRSLMVDHLVDVTSSDRHTVRPWFNGKIDFAPPVADFAGSGFPLVGGRLDYVAGRPVAALVYRHQPHLVNLFVWPTGARDEAPQQLSTHGYGILHWSAGGLQYWAISDIGMGELQRLADLVLQSESHAATVRE